MFIDSRNLHENIQHIIHFTAKGSITDIAKEHEVNPCICGKNKYTPRKVKKSQNTTKRLLSNQNKSRTFVEEKNTIYIKSK